MRHSATYSPEDNKLRLYPSCRLPEDEYQRVKRAGFIWAGKQGLFVAPTWSPSREDLLTEMCGEVEDEGVSATERSADRAERFDGYREKRADEAGGFADTFDSGPAAFGHQNAGRAERQAARHDRNRTRAVCQWSKAEYWHQRTAGVIAHALYKALPAVRRSRILRLEAEQRKHEKSREEYAARFAAWSKVSTMEGADVSRICGDDAPAPTPAWALAYRLANCGGCWGDYKHPRTGEERSLYSHLTDPRDPITAREAAALWLAGKPAPDAPDSYSARWTAHYALRLEYERAMLENEGGTAAAVEMEPGGWVQHSRRTGSVLTNVSGGWMQIHRVNRSPATGRIVSVKVMGTVGCQNPRPGLVSINIERLGADCYRPPTPEDREAVKVAKAAETAKTQARNAKAPKLINPTREAAEALQAVLNASNRYSGPREVQEITQAQYTAQSGGSYSKYQTRYLRAGGVLDATDRNMYQARIDRLPILCKVRSGYGFVVVITDKPQQALPDWTAPVAPVAEVVHA